MKYIITFLFAIIICSCTKNKENIIKSDIKFEINKDKYTRLLNTESGNYFKVKRIEFNKKNIDIGVEYKGGQNVHSFTFVRAKENCSQFIMIHDKMNDKSETLINEIIKMPITILNNCIALEAGIQIHNSFNNENYIGLDTVADYFGSLITVTKDQILVNKIKENKIRSDDYKIGVHSTNNNKILLPIIYSGGADRHAFKFVWTGNVENNKVNVYVIHNANNDKAEAYLTEILPIEKSLFGELGKSVEFNFINISNLKIGS